MTITTARHVSEVFHPFTDDLTERMTITFSRVEKHALLESVLKTVPGIVDVAGGRKGESRGGQCADESDLRFLRIIGLVLEGRGAQLGPGDLRIDAADPLRCA
jgi:hypothetical protein